MSDPVIWLTGNKAIIGQDQSGLFLGTDSSCCTCSEPCSVYARWYDYSSGCRVCDVPQVILEYSDDTGDNSVTLNLVNNARSDFTVYGEMTSALRIANISELSKCAEVGLYYPTSEDCKYEVRFHYKYAAFRVTVHWMFDDCQEDYVDNYAPDEISMYLEFSDGTSSSSYHLEKHTTRYSSDGHLLYYLPEGEHGVGEYGVEFDIYFCACDLLDGNGDYKSVVAMHLYDISAMDDRGPCSPYGDTGIYGGEPDIVNYCDCRGCPELAWSEELIKRDIKFALVSDCSVEYDFPGEVHPDTSSFCTYPLNPDPRAISSPVNGSISFYYGISKPGPMAKFPDSEYLLRHSTYVNSNPYARLIGVSYYKTEWIHGEETLVECSPYQNCTDCDTIVFHEYNPKFVRPNKISILYIKCGCCFKYTPNGDVLDWQPPAIYQRMTITIFYDLPNGETDSFDVNCYCTGDNCHVEYNYDLPCMVCSFYFDRNFPGFPICSISEKIGTARLVEVVDTNGTVFTGEELVSMGQLDDIEVDVVYDEYEETVRVEFYSNCGTNELEVERCDNSCSCQEIEIDELYSYTICRFDDPMKNPVYSPPYHWEGGGYHYEGDIQFYVCCDTSAAGTHVSYGGWIVAGGQKNYIEDLYDSVNDCIDLKRAKVKIGVHLYIEDYDPTTQLCCHGTATYYPPSITIRWDYSKTYPNLGSYSEFAIELDTQTGEYYGTTFIPCEEIEMGSPDLYEVWNNCMDVLEFHRYDVVPSELHVCAFFSGRVKAYNVIATLESSVYYSDDFPEELKNSFDALSIYVSSYTGYYMHHSGEVNDWVGYTTDCTSPPDCNNLSVDVYDTTYPESNFVPVYHPENTMCYQSFVHVDVELQLSPDIVCITVNLNGGSAEPGEDPEEVNASSTRGARSPVTGTIRIYLKKNSDIPSWRKPTMLNRDGYTFSRFYCSDCTEDNAVDEDGWPTHIVETPITVECVWRTTSNFVVILGDSAPDLPPEPGSPYDKSMRRNWPSTTDGTVQFPGDDHTTALTFTLNRQKSQYEASSSFEVMDESNPPVPFEFDGNESVGPSAGSAEFGPSTGYVGTAVTHFLQIWHPWLIRPDYWFQTACDYIYYPHYGSQNIFGFSMIMMIEDQVFTFTNPVGDGDNAYPSFMCDEYGKVGCEMIRVCEPRGLFHYGHPFYEKKKPEVDIQILGTSPDFVEVAQPFNKPGETCEPGGERHSRECSDGLHLEVSKDSNDEYMWPQMSCLEIPSGSSIYSVLVYPNVMIKYAGSGGGGGGGGGGDEDPKKWPWSITSYDSEWLISYNGYDSGDSSESEYSKYSIMYIGDNPLYKEFKWVVVGGNLDYWYGYVVAYNGQGEGDPDNYVVVYYGRTDSNDSDDSGDSHDSDVSAR